MRDNKIYVDSLPCKISWTTPLLLLCIVATIAAFVLCKLCGPADSMTGKAASFAGIALFVAMFSAILWIVFFAMFANACRNLPHHISMATMLMALTGSLGSVSITIGRLYSLGNVGNTGIVLWMVCLGAVLWLGNALSNNFASTLGEIGYALRKIMKIVALAIIFLFIYIFSGIFYTPIASYIGFLMLLGSLILGIWIMWVMLADVIVPIYQMLNWGNQEKVSQKDIQNCIISSK